MKCRYIFLFTALLLQIITFAQSNPSPQSLPYNQDFSALAYSSSVYPSGWQGWTISTTPGGIYNTSTPIADRALTASSSASSAVGNVHNYNGKIGFLNIGTLDLGIVLAINTSGKKNIQLSFDAMAIRNPYDSLSNNRINELTVQYRVGTTGAFTTLSGIEYQNIDAKQNGIGVTTPQHLESKTIILPSVCDSQSNVQLRWASRQVSGGGLRPSFAIDNIKVDTASTILVKSLADAFEGTSPTSGSFQFDFSPTTAAVTTFHYSFSGMATFNTDYTVNLSGGASPIILSSPTGVISVPAGTSSIVATISPINDAFAEGMESVRLAISTPSAGYASIDSVATLNIIDDENTLIHTIQGSGSTALKGTYNIEGIVTGVYPMLSPKGFYVQEEDIDTDADPKTSEGIYVVSNASVSIGDKISILGNTYEGSAYPSFEQAVISPIKINVLSSASSLPSATIINLPRVAGTDFEQYEGMLVRFGDTLTVTDNYDLGTRGEIKLSANGVIYQASQVVDPNDAIATGTHASGSSNVAAINAHLLQNDLRTILLDDGQASLPTLPYVNADNTLRIGSTIDSLWGIMGFAYGLYRVQPISIADVKINHQTRPTLPSLGASANVKVASFNVLSYFNGDGLGGGFPTARGANSLTEFMRQRDKIISTITQLNADVLGVIELENDGTGANSAVQNLLDGINAVLGAGTYSFIKDGDSAQNYNSDAIRCALFYKPSVLDTIGNLMTSSDTIFSRPPLAQAFKVKGTDSVFSFIINHFKSKGCIGSTGLDKDKLDGQGCYNNTRKLQAATLIDFINNVVIPNTGSKNVLSMGDYNSYFEEDPLDTIRSKGFDILSSAKEYSYFFDGQLGSLDNAFVSSALKPSVTGIAKWNINSVEPIFLNYEDSLNDGGGDLVNPWAATYTASPYRSSDHDPVMVGLHFSDKLSLEAPQTPAFKIYPNPTKNELYIEYSIYQNAKLILYNALGKELMRFDVPPNEHKIQVNIHELSAGIYLLKLLGDDGSSSIQRLQKW